MLHIGFPRKFGILVVCILNEFVEFNLCESFLFVDSLVRNLLYQFRNIVHRIHREGIFGFCASTGRVAHLELNGLRAIP